MRPIFIFPTVIIEHEINLSDIDDLLRFVKNTKEKLIDKDCKKDTYERTMWQSKADIHLSEEPVIKNLKNLILSKASEYMSFMKFQYERLEISNMWINTYDKNDNLHIHYHPNSFISGVVYLTEGSDLEFIDPNELTKNILSPEIYNEEFHNSMTFRYQASPGKIIMFPSWLKHSVLKNTNEYRVSIAFNLMFKGKIGSMDFKTHASF